MNKRLRLKKPKKFQVLLIVGALVYILFSGLFFLLHPTSIFSEVSDINHDQRDQGVIEISRDGSNSFSTTTNGLIRTINEYRKFWDNVDLSTESSPVFGDPSVEQGALASISYEEFKLIAQIIAFESGDSYEGALAVASCVINRLIEGGYIYEWDKIKRLQNIANKEDDPLAVLTSKNQFEAYTDNYYLEYQHNLPVQVKNAVIDCFVNGKRNHNYTSFRSYEQPQAEKIGGNYFFSPIVKEARVIRFSVSTPKDDSYVFNNEDPNGLGNWDLLYLICAYDASKKNLEGEPEDYTSRYADLLYGIGEYIIKAAFGTTVEVQEEVLKPAEYAVYEETPVVVYENGSVSRKVFYKISETRKSNEPLSVPEFKKVRIHTVENMNEDFNLENIQIIDGKDMEIIVDDRVYKLNQREDLFEKTGNTIEIKPGLEEVTTQKRVVGLQKAVLLEVLGLKPNEPYKVLSSSSSEFMTNADYIELCRENLIRTLELNETEFSFINRETGTVSTSLEGSDIGWIWPLDPNGQGAFIITSLMGNRESPGGIGSTDHGGTDIGAFYGVPILAVQDGRVEIANIYGGYGNCVKIDHGKLEDGNIYQTLYGHMSKINVKSGNSVKKGEVIGYVGSTGWSTGPHLHFEVIKNKKKVNGLSMYNKKILDKLVFQL